MTLESSPDAALAEALGIVDRLHATCCVPERSPRMLHLIATLGAARQAIARFDPEGRSEASALLAEAGAEVGWLQVACCAESRLPRYTEILARLTAAYRAVESHGH